MRLHILRREEPPVDVSDHELVKQNLGQNCYRVDARYLISLRELRDERRVEQIGGRGPSPFGHVITAGPGPTLPSGVLFWKRWSKSFKLAHQVLKDMQRDNPALLHSNHPWLGNRTLR